MIRTDSDNRRIALRKIRVAGYLPELQRCTRRASPYNSRVPAYRCEFQVCFRGDQVCVLAHEAWPAARHKLVVAHKVWVVVHEAWVVVHKPRVTIANARVRLHEIRLGKLYVEVVVREVWVLVREVWVLICEVSVTTSELWVLVRQVLVSNVYSGVRETEPRVISAQGFADRIQRREGCAHRWTRELQLRTTSRCNRQAQTHKPDFPVGNLSLQMSRSRAFGSARVCNLYDGVSHTIERDSFPDYLPGIELCKRRVEPDNLTVTFTARRSSRSAIESERGSSRNSGQRSDSRKKHSNPNLVAPER